MPSRRQGPDHRPVYQRIADQLRDAYEPSAQLPTVAAIMQQWTVAEGTVRAAIDVLRHEGIIDVYQGLGTFYRPHRDREHDTDLASALRQLAALVQRVDTIDTRLRDLERTREHRPAANRETSDDEGPHEENPQVHRGSFE